MTQASWSALVLLLTVPLVLASCGGSDGKSQHASRIPADFPRRPWERPPYMYANVHLPPATNVRWDRISEDRVVVNVLRLGDLRLGNNDWPLSTASASEREVALGAFVAELVRLAAERDAREGSGYPVAVFFHAGQRVDWPVASDVLRRIVARPIRADRLLIGVESDATRREVVLAARVSPLPTGGSDQDRNAPRITLSEDGILVERDGTRHPVLEAPWLTPSPQRTSMEDWRWTLDLLDRAAPALASRLRGQARAVLRLPEADAGLSWGLMVRILDIGLGAGVRSFDVPRLGVRLTLEEPQELIHDPFLHTDDPVLTLPTLVLSLLALGVAFGVTLAPLRARQSRTRKKG